MPDFSNYKLEDIYAEIDGIGQEVTQKVQQRNEYIKEAVKRLKNNQERSSNQLKDFVFYYYNGHPEALNNFTDLQNKIKTHPKQLILVIEREKIQIAFSDPPGGEQYSGKETLKIGRLNADSIKLNISDSPNEPAYSFPTKYYLISRDHKTEKIQGNIVLSDKFDLAWSLNTELPTAIMHDLYTLTTTGNTELEIIIGDQEVKYWHTDADHWLHELFLKIAIENL